MEYVVKNKKGIFYNFFAGFPMKTSQFGMRLKELREAAGMTQRQLGEAAGVGQRSVSHWEQGLRGPSWENVVALADALGVDCRSFLKKPADVKPAGRGRPRKEK
jgi:transcriptional regulator with XRE-family HTH domain